MSKESDILHAAADLCDAQTTKASDPELSHSLALVFRTAAIEIEDGKDGGLLYAVTVYAECVVREMQA